MGVECSGEEKVEENEIWVRGWVTWRNEMRRSSNISSYRVLSVRLQIYVYLKYVFGKWSFRFQ